MFSFSLDTTADTLVVKVSYPGPKRVFYRDTLLALAKGKEKEALEFLTQEKLSAYNEIPVSKERSHSALKLLACTGNLFWKGKKLLVDPFTKVEFFYEGTFEDNGVLKVEGILKVGEKKKPAISCDLLFGGSPSWCISEGILQFFQERIDPKWLKLVHPSCALLTGKEKEDFCELFQEGDEPGHAPSIIWKNSSPTNYALSSTPFLILKDQSGGFADLWFDYPGKGRVSAHERAQNSWRNQKLEESWEKDLLETGFLKKMLGNSHYYCPLHQVPATLTLLLDLGWKIFDVKGRELIKQTQFHLSLKGDAQTIFVKAHACFGEEEIGIEKLAPALHKKEPFLPLSENFIGLIDHASIEQHCGSLLEEEISMEGIRIPKFKLGLIETLYENPVIEKDPEIKALFSEKELLGSVSVGASFSGKLYSYQEEGLKWLIFLHTQGFSGLLADEMGLGKTVQVLAFLSTLCSRKPVLLVVPTSLLFNWKREFEKFLPTVSVYLHNGAKRMKEKHEFETCTHILTSYAMLRQDGELLRELDYSMVILDEAQQIKNSDSQTAKQVFSLKAELRLAMTGTPIENRYEELWSLFHFLMPKLLGEKQTFSTHAKTQLKKVRPFILRRRKEEVAHDLPPKIEQLVWIDMTPDQKTRYETWAAKQKTGLLKKISQDGASLHRIEILEAILRLRQMACHPILVDAEYQGTGGKLEQLQADLEEAIDQKRKVLIFSQFTEMLQLMCRMALEKNWPFAYLDGSTKDRETPVRRFQEDPDLSLFFISLKAGGVGLNLTAADTVILFDPWWNEAVEQQAIDRAHRIGRKGAVIAKRYICVDSIEEKMLLLKKHKTSLTDELFDGGEVSMWTLEDFYALL
jgi:superfamily II DNA or RNA helicase